MLLCLTAKKKKFFFRVLSACLVINCLPATSKNEILPCLLVPSASSTNADRQEASKRKGPGLIREPGGPPVFSGAKTWRVTSKKKKKDLKLEPLSC